MSIFIYDIGSCKVTFTHTYGGTELLITTSISPPHLLGTGGDKIFPLILQTVILLYSYTGTY